MSADRARERAVLGAATRSVAMVAVLLFVYYQAPLDRELDPLTWLLFGAGLLLLAVAVVVEVRSILRSDRPRLRAVQTLLVGVPVLLVVFAAAYVTVDTQQAGAFNASLTRTDSLYFTMTTFATVGYGDIVPVTQLARLLVTIQMVAGLLTVGVIAKVVLGAARVAAERRSHTAGPVRAPEPARGPELADAPEAE